MIDEEKNIIAYRQSCTYEYNVSQVSFTCSHDQIYLQNLWKQSECHELLCFHVKIWIINSLDLENFWKKYEMTIKKFENYKFTALISYVYLFYTLPVKANFYLH